MKKTSYTRSLMVVLMAFTLVSGAAMAQTWDGGSATNNDDGGDDQSAYSNTTTPSGDGSDSGSDDGSFSGGESTNTETDNSDSETQDSETTSSGGGWDGGSATNDDDGTSTNSTWNGSSASNDDDGSGSSGQWDGDTASNNDDGDNDSTQWDGDTSTNNDDGGDGETEWNGDTASNNDDGDNDSNDPETPSDDDSDENQETDPEEQDSSDSSSSSDSGGGGGAVWDPANIEIHSPGVNFQLSPAPAHAGEPVTVTGSLDYSTSEQVEVIMNGNVVTETGTDSDGSFTTTFTPESPGTHTVTVRASDASADTQLDVNPTVNVENIQSEVSYNSPAEVSVCADVRSQSTPDVRLVSDGETLGSKSQKGNVCFQPSTLDDGSHELKMVAEVEGDSDEAYTNVNINNPDQYSNVEPANENTGLIAGILQPLAQAFAAIVGLLAQLAPV